MFTALVQTFTFGFPDIRPVVVRVAFASLSTIRTPERNNGTINANATLISTSPSTTINNNNVGAGQGLAAGHHSAEVAEMSALLSASILSRGLSPEERLEERERVKLGGGGDSVEGSEATTAKMLLALDAAEEDLRSDAVPMRARGVVTLTRSVRCS